MLVLFLECKLRDYQGRFLKDIWLMEDTRIEKVHDFIQWVFPTDEVSKSVPSAPVLFDDEIEEIKTSELAKENLLKSKEWFLNFLIRTNSWEEKRDHNHKRISRMIKSLRILHSTKEADKCLVEVLNLAKSRSFSSKNVMKFWETC